MVGASVTLQILKEILNYIIFNTYFLEVICCMSCMIVGLLFIRDIIELVVLNFSEHLHFIHYGHFFLS